MQQRIITRKTEVRELLKQFEKYPYSRFLEAMDKEILRHKVKFPILEFIADSLFEAWEFELLLKLCDDVADLDYISSWPFIGKVFWKNLENDLELSFEKAKAYIIQGNEWHVCDSISERVFGNGLLLDFDRSYAQLKTMQGHSNEWIRRAPGIAAHFAAKRGIETDEARILLEMLLLQKNAPNIQVQKGCGWGIETIAKFHPGLALKYQRLIFDGETKAWVVRKYKLGLMKAEQRKQKG